MDSQEKQFMPHISDEERLKVMNDNFERVEEAYVKILTDAEISETRTELDKLVIEIDTLEDALTEYVKPRKDEIKQKKMVRRGLSEITKYGQIDTKAELFIMKDFHQKMAYLRDDNGILVKVRPLTSEEIQGKLY